MLAAGPGSFPGVRIGVAAAKGLAWPRDLPCAPCSTLESMAWPCTHMGMEICAVMDARRNQVYAARFLGDGNTLLRLSEDRATGVELLAEEAKKSGKTQILVGDGAELCYNAFIQMGIPAVIPPRGPGGLPHGRSGGAGFRRCHGPLVPQAEPGRARALGAPVPFLRPNHKS